MATSGSTNFDSTVQEIIADSYAMINVYGADENPSAEDAALARRVLNRMIKSWAAQELHLWKKSTATIFLQKDQASYTLASTGDHATLSYTETTLSADEAIGQVTLSVTSSSGMTVGDYIAVENDDNELAWSTITVIPDATSVTINDALTVAASEDAKVYAYTTRLDRPFNVLSAVRESESATDVPMNALSYESYFQLPNKTSTGIPVSYNYDRQKDSAVIRIWPVPANVENLMKITITERIEDVDSVSNTMDFPQEWLEAIVLNLAVRLAPSFGRAGNNNFMEIKAQAAEALNLALGFDNEPGSIYIQPDNDGMGDYGRP